MGKVLEFKKDEPTNTGPARCLRCNHEWVAVAPVGTLTGLDCPACGCYTGALLGEVIPEGYRWECLCGCDLFRITPNGTLCANCGCQQTGFN